MEEKGFMFPHTQKALYISYILQELYYHPLSGEAFVGHQRVCDREEIFLVFSISILLCIQDTIIMGHIQTYRAKFSYQSQLQ